MAKQKKSGGGYVINEKRYFFLYNSISLLDLSSLQKRYKTLGKYAKRPHFRGVSAGKVRNPL